MRNTIGFFSFELIAKHNWFMKRVVITGMGAITPLGNNVEDFWSNLLKGESGANMITRFDASKFKARFACEVKGFNVEAYIHKKEARRYDLFTQYGVAAAEQAIRQACFSDEVDKNRIGVIWGAGNGGISTYDQEMIDYVKRGMEPKFNPFLIPKMIVDICAGVISIRHGFRGVNYATVSACATSTTAIIDAFNNIRLGKADAIISGGSEAAITHSAIGGFTSSKALSTNNDNFMTASRPFDKTRDGFVMGEGAGALVLESFEHAKQRGATILAEIVGGGMAADAYHLTGTHPEGEGGFLAMKLAVEEAGISPDEVDYLNAHATSTPGGDGNELIGVQRVFGKGENLHISATKSMTGHLLGAAGAVEAIACVKACADNQIPPTINTQDMEDGIDRGLHIVLGKKIAKSVNYALSNSFGFGGHTASVLFKKYE